MGGECVATPSQGALGAVSCGRDESYAPGFARCAR